MLLGRIANYGESTKNVLHNIAFNTIEFYGSDNWKVNRRLTLDLGARFYHLGKWYDREGAGFAIFDASKFDKANPVNKATGVPSGVFFNKSDSSIPLSGAPTKSLLVAPRVGFAYDLFGTGKTVVRGGFGRSYYHDAQLTSGLDLALGLRKVGGTGTTTFGDVDARYANEAAARAAADLPTTFETLSRGDDTQPYVDSYSLTLQQRLPFSLNLEASYVGNRSRNQLYGQNINLVPLNTAGCKAAALAGGNCDAFRPLQGLGDVNIQSHIAYQNYNSAQFLLSRQIGKVNFLTSYTFSKALGIKNGGNQGSAADQLDLRGHNYGILGYDRTHALNFAYTIEVPKFASEYLKTNNIVAKGLLDGWVLSGISQFASGYPLQANSTNFRFSGSLNQTCKYAKTGASAALCAGKLDTDTVTLYNPGNAATVTGSNATSAQPTLTCDPRSGLSDGQYANLNCFGPPAVGQLGVYQFPYLKGPAYNAHDLTLSKVFAIRETKKLLFRISTNNIFNHPLQSLVEDNLRLEYVTDNPDSATPKLIPNANTVKNFGRYTENKFGRRIVTLGVKFTF